MATDRETAERDYVCSGCLKSFDGVYPCEHCGYGKGRTPAPTVTTYDCAACGRETKIREGESDLICDACGGDVWKVEPTVPSEDGFPICEEGSPHLCQHCFGPLSAKVGVGQYECPRCIEMYPEEEPGFAWCDRCESRSYCERLASCQAPGVERRVKDRREGCAWCHDGFICESCRLRAVAEGKPSREWLERMAKIERAPPRHRRAGMSNVITDEDRALLKEVKADPIARDLLKAKCRWEHMTLSAVLKEWGDPRTWRSYDKERIAWAIREGRTGRRTFAGPPGVDDFHAAEAVLALRTQGHRRAAMSIRERLEEIVKTAVALGRHLPEWQEAMLDDRPQTVEDAVTYFMDTNKAVLALLAEGEPVASKTGLTNCSCAPGKLVIQCEDCDGVRTLYDAAHSPVTEEVPVAWAIENEDRSLNCAHVHESNAFRAAQEIAQHYNVDPSVVPLYRRPPVTPEPVAWKWRERIYERDWYGWQVSLTEPSPYDGPNMWREIIPLDARSLGAPAPHDWGMDSYRCLRCGCNRDNAPDQPCVTPEPEGERRIIGQLMGWLAGRDRGVEFLPDMEEDGGRDDFSGSGKATLVLPDTGEQG